MNHVNTVTEAVEDASTAQIEYEELGAVSEATQATKLFIGFEQEDPFIYWGE